MLHVSKALIDFRQANIVVLWADTAASTYSLAVGVPL